MKKWNVAVDLVLISLCETCVAGTMRSEPNIGTIEGQR